MEQEETESLEVNQKKKSLLLVILGLFLVIAILALIWKQLDEGNAEAPKSTEPDITEQVQNESVEKLTNSISAPGYISLEFKANETEQNIVLPNPPENFVWFRMSLILEDGTVLWTSNLVAPGDISEPIVLGKPLEEGEYANAVLKYDSFADEAGRNALNGVATPLTIIVK